MRRYKPFGHFMPIAAVVAVVLFTVVTPAIPVSAAAGITLSQSLAAPGDHISVHGSGFHSGDKASVVIVAAGAGPTLTRVAGANATVSGSGNFDATLTVPRKAPAGAYAVVAQDTQNNLASQTFQVPAPFALKSGKTGPRVVAVAGLHVSIQGTGFKSGETVTLQATFPLYGGGNRKESKTATADKNGSFGPVDMQVPWRARDGDVSLTATGQQSGKSGTATATLTVTHKPYLLPLPQAAAGGNATLRGGGFVPGTKVTVSLPILRSGASGTTLAKTVPVGGLGNITAVLSLPPNARPHTYTITASSAPLRALTRLTVTGPAATPAATPSAKSTPTPSHGAITVAPLSVIPGANAQIRGTGFAPGAQVTITVTVRRTNGPQSTLRTTSKADRKGAFTATVHTPGDAAGGKYRIAAKSAHGQTAGGTLVIAVLKTSVVVVPALAVPGTMITVNGFGFSSGGHVVIYLAGQRVGTVTANAQGGFKTSLRVPSKLATGFYTLAGQESTGRKASIGLRIYRRISTHFYFASLYTGSGFHEYLLFVNTSPIRARVSITYQRSSGAPRSTSIEVPAHARVTRDVNRDLGAGVNASAVIGTDVPIVAERMVIHGGEGSLDPGTTSPSRIWYFANGNTSHRYQEYIAVQNPTNGAAQVTLQVQPTHSHTFYLHRTMPPQSRTTWHLNRYVHDAIGVIVTASRPVVANRTIFIHRGITSKTGVKGPQTHWYFAAGPTRGGTRHWIGVINTTNRPSYLTLHAYNAQGAELATIKRRLRPYDREGYLMNKYAGQTDVAVAVTTAQSSIAEQSTFVIGNHDAHTDSFGVTKPQKTAQFAEATTWAHQDNLLAIFNPNLVPVPVVVQFLNARGSTKEQTYVVAPLAHQFVDVGRVMPNAQLGLLAASNDPFVAMDRQVINDGAGAMTSLGTQS